MSAALLLPAADFQVADFNYLALAPMIIVFAGALVGVLVEAFAPRAVRYPAQLGIAVASLVAAFAEHLQRLVPDL